MKINCGPDWEEKAQKKKTWRKWFAWYPVHVGKNDCRWLEYVERKGTFWWDSGGGAWYYDYRAINEGNVK